VDYCDYKEIDNKIKSVNATHEEKIKHIKFNLCENLGVDNINPDILGDYYNNISTVYNLMNLVDVSNFKHNETDKYKQKFTKVLLVKDMLNVLGFSNTFNSNIYVSSNDFIDNFKNVYGCNLLFTNPDMIKTQYNIKPFKYIDSVTSNKQILGHINSVLDNFNLKICSNQKKIRNKEKLVNEYSYNITVLKNCDEIIRYKILKGYKFYDSNNIFHCSSDKINYLELFNKNKVRSEQKKLKLYTELFGNNGNDDDKYEFLDGDIFHDICDDE